MQVHLLASEYRRAVAGLTAAGLADDVELLELDVDTGLLTPGYVLSLATERAELERLAAQWGPCGPWPYLWVATSEPEIANKLGAVIERWPLRRRDWIQVSEPDAIWTELTARLNRQCEVERILAQPWLRDKAVGDSTRWRAVLEQVVRAARYGQGACLLQGQSGCGKEVLAHLMHDLNPARCEGPFVIVDCTTLSPELSGSELFGHSRGAFTNAVAAREGAVAYANGGTLFLDEIGELDMSLQAPLLRLIQERTYKPVGEDRWRTSDFRLVCATNRDLLAEVQAGRFRHDLYHRVCQWTVRVPNLHERRDDIPALVHHFLAQAGYSDVSVMPSVMRDLTEADYPGNVRDLRNTVMRMADSLGDAKVISSAALALWTEPTDDDAWALESEADELSPAPSPATVTGHPGQWQSDFDAAVYAAVVQGMGLKAIGEWAESAAVNSALAHCRTQKEAAALLGVTPRALQSRRAAKRVNEP